MGFLIAQATKHNIPSIIAETGGKGAQTTPKAVVVAAEGIINIMKYLRILDKPFGIKNKKVTFLKDCVMVGAPYGGRFVPSVEIREKVKKQQIIARIYSIFDEELEPIRSPIDGVILTFSREPFVNAGSYIFQIGTPE